MHLQHMPGYMEADKMVEAFIARPDMAQAISEIKRAAAEGDDAFLASVILRAYLGSTPIEG